MPLFSDLEFGCRAAPLTLPAFQVVVAAAKHIPDLEQLGGTTRILLKLHDAGDAA